MKQVIMFAVLIVIIFAVLSGCGTPPASTPGTGGNTPTDTTVPVMTKATATIVDRVTIKLDWSAGTDNTTASAALVYEICQATTTANCNPFTATYTAPAGTVTSNATGLTSGTTYYFAIRAKDEAGNASLLSWTSAVTTPNYTYDRSFTTASVLCDGVVWVAYRGKICQGVWTLGDPTATFKSGQDIYVVTVLKNVNGNIVINHNKVITASSGTDFSLSAITMPELVVVSSFGAGPGNYYIEVSVQTNGVGTAKVEETVTVNVTP